MQQYGEKFELSSSIPSINPQWLEENENGWNKGKERKEKEKRKKENLNPDNRENRMNENKKKGKIDE